MEHEKSVCPYCEEPNCEADWVNVEVGYIQCGPYHCENCGAFQIGPYDAPHVRTAREKETGWYEPKTDPTISAGNVVGGKFVSHEYARQVYRMMHPYSATEEGRQRIRSGEISVETIDEIEQEEMDNFGF